MSIRNQKGQSLVEYLVIVALVGVASIAMMRAVGQNVQARFADVVHALGGKVEGNRDAAAVSSNAYSKKDLTNFVSGAINRNDKNKK